jgi:membrane-bound ClpP family serine protease
MRFDDTFDDRALARKPCRNRLREALESACVGLLLLSVVVSAIVGAEAVLMFTVLAAWLLFPLLVGLRNTLDAGCAFMLISLGIVVVVWLAQHGPGSLMP